MTEPLRPSPRGKQAAAAIRPPSTHRRHPPSEASKQPPPADRSAPSRLSNGAGSRAIRGRGRTDETMRRKQTAEGEANG